jgi:hypothetical protein
MKEEKIKRNNLNGWYTIYYKKGKVIFFGKFVDKNTISVLNQIKKELIKK